VAVERDRSGLKHVASVGNLVELCEVETTVPVARQGVP